MKTIKRLFALLIALAIVVELVINLSACSQNVSPLAFDSTHSGVQILKLRGRNSSPSLNKVVTVSQPITMLEGGEVSLHHKPSNDVSVTIRLTVLPGTINADAVVTIALDDELFIVNFDIVSEQHTVTFNQPPVLSIDAEGLDLSEIDVESLDIFYDNPDTGEWEPISADGFTVDGDTQIMAVTGDIMIRPTSRYGIGAE